MSFLVTDIETVPESGVGELPEPTPDNPDPFPPLPCHKIVCVGYMWFDSNYVPQTGGIPHGFAGHRHEELGLEEYVSVARDKTIVTWNGRSFDLPVIVLRCFHYGIQIPWYYRDKFGHRYRFSADGHLDVMDYLGDYGAARNLKLNDAARLIGLPGKLDTNGASVYQMWKDGKHAEIGNYCMTDVAQTAFVWLRQEHIRGALGLEEYRASCEALLEKCSKNETRYGQMLAKTDRKILLIEKEDRSAERSVDGGGEDHVPALHADGRGLDGVQGRAGAGGVAGGEGPQDGVELPEEDPRGGP